MKKTLGFVALAVVLAMTAWVTNVEAMEATSELQICMVSQDVQVGHQDSRPGGLTPPLIAKYTDAQTPSADALTCRQIYDECVAQCHPDDWYCPQDCQCQLIMCHGYQCN